MQHVFGINGDKEVIFDQQACVQKRYQSRMVHGDIFVGGAGFGLLIFAKDAMGDGRGQNQIEAVSLRQETRTT
jgi:hypothetical protein